LPGFLDTSNTRLGLEELGFSHGELSSAIRGVQQAVRDDPATGPTGSGKSTTLYATLNQLNKPEVNVITVEDPVEYRLVGINQVQTNVRAGLTFASALRSILRSDPDIVLIGEIRDHETAQIAIEAALTGHLVLSTLHTNDAPSAVTRLVEMGIEPFLVGSAVDAVLAQRLCRSLCERCREAYQPSEQQLVDLDFPWTEGTDVPTLHRAKGCTKCADTGYRGRLALHEVMTVTEEIERLAVARASTDDIGRAARDQGMSTLRHDGWLKVLAGKTSVERSCAWSPSCDLASTSPRPRRTTTAAINEGTDVTQPSSSGSTPGVPTASFVLPLAGPPAPVTTPVTTPVAVPLAPATPVAAAPDTAPPAAPIAGTPARAPVAPAVLVLDELLIYVLRTGSSDLHLTAGAPPTVRKSGEMRVIEGYNKLRPVDLQEASTAS
jgi:energy-coupling factor transporter ATP-binding protein EcfA2